MDLFIFFRHMLILFTVLVKCENDEIWNVQPEHFQAYLYTWQREIDI